VQTSLDPALMEEQLASGVFRKIGLTSFSSAVSDRLSGGLTVSAALPVAQNLGDRLLVTGGLGGVHPDDGNTGPDVSADLAALASTSVHLVCAGLKPILAIDRTLAVLESNGTPVVGLETQTLPLLYANSDRRLGNWRESVIDCARLLEAQKILRRGAVVACPVPEATALAMEELHDAVLRARARAVASRVHGDSLTPFLIKELRSIIGDRLDVANEAALVNNVMQAIAIAKAWQGD
jgi:pseudouridine-5'-phosphate glycosidase